MSKLNHLNRSDRAKYNAKLGDLLSEVSKNSGIVNAKAGEKFAITDSADAPLAGIKIYGKTSQIQTSGANLFDVFNETYEKVNNRAKEEVTEDGTLKIISTYEISQVAHRAVIPMDRFEVGDFYISTLIKCEIEGATPGIYVSFYNSTNGTTKGGSSKFITAPKTPTEYSLKFTITEDIKSSYDIVRIVFYISQNAETKVPVGGCSEFAKCMVSHNEDAKYEPYTGLSPSPSPQYSQRMNIVSPGDYSLCMKDSSDKTNSGRMKIEFPLRGIPVPKDGNVTDENGQMWVADEIDSEKGIYIQRVAKVDNSLLVIRGYEDEENILAGYVGVEMPVYKKEVTYPISMCTHCRALPSVTNGTAGETARGVHVSMYNNWKGDTNRAWYLVMPKTDVGTTTESLQEYFKTQEEAGTPFEWFYILHEPIVTQISPEQISHLKKLNTFKPVTNVINNAGAITEVSYYADKKNYIDQKFDELKALALENK